MNILVTGANGQLARCLKDIVDEYGNGAPNAVVGDPDYWIFADREVLDITNSDAVTEFVRKNYINVIVNCAAYTNVNKAEEECDAAYSINAYGARNLASSCEINGAVLIHISTDYVFDGSKGAPYEPGDLKNPLNEYGKSKSEGETLIEQSGCKYLIFRTSWLYSQYGHNFVKSIYKQWKEMRLTQVVFDQIGSPTNANDLALFIYNIITNNNAETRYLSKSGIYHYCNTGVASWFDLAEAVYSALENMQIDTDVRQAIVPTKTDKNAAIKRPSVSVLDTQLTQEMFNEYIPYWRDSLTDVIYKIIENEE